MALENNFHTYQGVIAAGIKVLRPHIEVETCEDLATLEQEVVRFEPHLVISSQPSTVHPGGTLAWIELPVEAAQPIKSYIGGCYVEFSGHTSLEKLLGVIDEVEELETSAQRLPRLRRMRRDYS